MESFNITRIERAISNMQKDVCKGILSFSRSFKRKRALCAVDLRRRAKLFGNSVSQQISGYEKRSFYARNGVAAHRDTCSNY